MTAAALHPMEWLGRLEGLSNRPEAPGRDDGERAALYQHYWLGLSLVEIAELLACPPGTVKSYLYRGHGRLAKALGEGWDV